MKAIVMHERGAAEVLRYQDAPDPVPGLDEVRLRVKAATVNHTDIFHREGRVALQKPLPHILGSDVAGTIEALGAGVTDWKLGDRVVATFEALGRARDGAYAELTTVPVAQLRRVPLPLDFEAAASVGLAFLTAWVALVDRAQLGVAEQVVITAASSGVGTACLQIAKWKGATVVALVGDATSALGRQKAERLRALGADAVFETRGGVPGTAIRERLGGGATLVVEHVAGSGLAASVGLLAEFGRVVCIGTLAGDRAELDILELITKNIQVIGSCGTVSRKSFERILEHFADGTFRPVIDRVLPLSEARIAHELIERRETLGKIVLVP